MVKKTTKTAINSKKQYPAIVVGIIAVLSLLFGGADWFTSLFSSQPGKEKKEVTSTSSNSSKECEVINVYDGDTLTIKCPGEKENTKVRMYCIDTPEMQQEPWGQQSRDHLRTIVGKTVSIAKIDTDRYGRIVGEVYSGEVNLNLAQVKAGKAAVYQQYCKKPEYSDAQKTAELAHLGIWSKPGIHQTPWNWRKQNK